MWISRWADIDDKESYLVFPIHGEATNLHLGPTIGCNMGWQVKRLRERCYVALLVPEITQADLKEAIHGPG